MTTTPRLDRMAGSFSDFLGDLEAIQVQPTATGGQEYAVIGARTNARWWLLPLDDRHATAAGLEMLQPVNWRAALSKGIARTATQIGLGKALGRQRLRLSGTPNLREEFSGEAWSFAYFTGTNGPHRKTAIQIMGRGGEILGYAKLSRLPTVRRFIAAEAAMLDHVDALGLRTADVPRKLTYAEDAAVALLVTDSLKTRRSSAPKRLTPQHLAFLDELAQRTGGRGATEALDHLAGQAKLLHPNLTTEWRKRFANGVAQLEGPCEKLAVGLAHGDFTPWNAFCQDGRLYVFDWEYADHAYPLGYDQVSFMLATANSSSTTKIIERLVSSLMETHFKDDRHLANACILFSLLIHAGFYLRRSVEAGESVIGFDRDSLRGSLIDTLIDRMHQR